MVATCGFDVVYRFLIIFIPTFSPLGDILIFSTSNLNLQSYLQ